MLNRTKIEVESLKRDIQHILRENFLLNEDDLLQRVQEIYEPKIPEETFDNAMDQLKQEGIIRYGFSSHYRDCYSLV